jgi:hypothetical protein
VPEEVLPPKAHVSVLVSCAGAHLFCKYRVGFAPKSDERQSRAAVEIWDLGSARTPCASRSNVAASCSRFAPQLIENSRSRIGPAPARVVSGLDIVESAVKRVGVGRLVAETRVCALY